MSSAYPRSDLCIVMVTKNAENYIEATLKSILRFVACISKLVIVDGASSDNTLHIVRMYSSKINIVLLSEPDTGIYSAMNKGWRLCGEEDWILYLGAGDELLRLPSLALLKEYDKASILYGDVILGERLFRSSVGFRMLLGNTIHHQGLFINRSKFSSGSPFNETFQIYGDYDLCLRLFKVGVKFSYLDFVVSRALPGGVSAKYQLLEMVRAAHLNYGIAGRFLMKLSVLYFKARLGISESYRQRVLGKCGKCR